MLSIALGGTELAIRVGPSYSVETLTPAHVSRLGSSPGLEAFSTVPWLAPKRLIKAIAVDSGTI